MPLRQASVDLAAAATTHRAHPRRERIEVPTGFAAFPHEMTNLAPPRPALERDFNLTHFTRMAKGGHFGCFEQPKAFVADVREFFRSVRS